MKSLISLIFKGQVSGPKVPGAWVLTPEEENGFLGSSVVTVADNALWTLLLEHAYLDPHPSTFLNKK